MQIYHKQTQIGPQKIMFCFPGTITTAWSNDVAPNNFIAILKRGLPLFLNMNNYQVFPLSAIKPVPSCCIFLKIICQI